MSDLISQLYHGEALHVNAPCPLDNDGAALSRHMERVRREMGEPFARELDGILRRELNGGRTWAFYEGFRLGGRLMIELLKDDD